MKYVVSVLFSIEHTSERISKLSHSVISVLDGIPIYNLGYVLLTTRSNAVRLHNASFSSAVLFHAACPTLGHWLPKSLLCRRI